MIEGDALELPTQFVTPPRTMLGFSESVHEMGWIDGLSHPWGFATVTPVQGAFDTAVVSRFMDKRLRSLRDICWSEAIPRRDLVPDAVWIALPSLIVVKPWQAPTTWDQLTELCAHAGLDLPSILAEAGAVLRRTQRPNRPLPVTLLLGFPLAELVGGPLQRLHWLAVRNMQLCGRNEVRNGFRATLATRGKWDREAARADRPLNWRRTANWAPDQLRKRGQAEQEVREKSILVLGVGTLGAAVAENLLRMGMSRMALLDEDTLTVGNLSRHLLTLSDVGQSKAERMAKRLNAAMPDARVKAMNFSFPPLNAADARELSSWDVVVDCTASDAVLKAMEAFDWGMDRTFVSLAMTWQAQGLFAYAATGARFPAAEALAKFLAVAPPGDLEGSGEMEGIGCWHPVFPATAGDVNLWAAVGTNFVRRSIVDRQTVAALYKQHEDGSVERTDA
ncbi:ThiF family adenylyltransferase [Stenotrophomonas sp.]|uniref:ThiF family adenylyltransferase n=1 Tax=Stenotrophomonas sp. TaxID=69392 RepID=UPI0028AE359F|nr:ThiF family adenylyltransferase [Stenotrophomonas sp.]